MRRRLMAVAAVASLAVGYATADLLDLAPGAWSVRPVPTVTVAPPVVIPTTPPAPQPALVSVAPRRDLATAPMPTADGLAKALGGQLTAPAMAATSLLVRDALTGADLVAREPDLARIPASTTKLLTLDAVVRTVPATTTLTTRAVTGPRAGSVLLVAGGDSLLGTQAGNAHSVVGRAGLADLADQTAAALTTSGTTQITLGMDTTYASGPAYAPTWSPAFRSQGIVGSVSMLALAEDRTTLHKPAPERPEARALATFADRLRERGLTVTLGPPETAPERATSLGTVSSATVGELVELAILDSDNTLTEALARQAAATARAAGQPGAPATGPLDFPAVASWAVRSAVSSGVPAGGLSLVDASGLSRENRLTARALAHVLVTAGADPARQPLVAGMPIAGLTGTLAGRFGDGPGRAGAGVVHAKTGTLTGANGLAGTVLTADGRLLVFVMLVQDAGTSEARAALDEMAAGLASCGCR